MVQFLNSTPWWAYSLLANVAVNCFEYLNRTGNYQHFGQALIHTGFFILVSQFGLFYAWRDGPSIMMVWSFFTACNVMMRMASSHFFVGERVTMLAIFGVTMIIVGGLVVKEGMHQ